MGEGRRRDLYRFQAHTFVDGLGACISDIPRRNRFDVELHEVLCPLCLHWFELAALDEDHAPPMARQSRLGDAHLLVLTCREDDHAAGRTFERVRAGEAAATQAMPHGECLVHSSWALRSSGLVVPLDRAAALLTDTKAAYLVAFAALGYRWVVSERLDQVRAALRQRAPALLAGEVELLCGCVDWPYPRRTIVEVDEPYACIVVIGDGVAVKLPADGSPAGPLSDLQSGLGGVRRRVAFTAKRDRPWPAPYVDRLPEPAWDEIEGTMFHFDRCSNEEHHLHHAVTREDLLSLL